MLNDRVLIFVDALPWAERERIAAALPAMSWARPVQPGFGYSVNVKSELFAGQRPDEAGFLNEWTHRPGAGALRFPIPGLVDRLFPGTSFHGRVLRKLLGRQLGENVRNIPLHLLAHLGRDGINAYECAYPGRSLFTDLGVERFLYSQHGSDGAALEALLQHIDEQQEPVAAFLGTADLDHAMHSSGLGSDAYHSAVQAACDAIEAIWSRLERRGNGASLCLVSDHGMAPVERSVTIELEEDFAGAGRRYGYFVDATMLRVWSEDSALIEAIRAHVEAQALPGSFLSPEERERWGVGREEFGQLLFLLDEGAMFAPGFMGRAACAAMHGYLPSLASQMGLLACTHALAGDGSDEPLAATDVYQALCGLFGNRPETAGAES